MGIDGILIEQDDSVSLCRITNFSDALKNIIREALASVARGAAQAKELKEYYNYHNTLKEFLARYSGKADDTKKGMIGELLSHILIPLLYENLTCLSVYFNKEERSIKKGFDIIYCDMPKQAIWYSEVKSGQKNKEKPTDTANIELLNRAYNDLKSKLTESRSSLWDSALIDIGLVLEAQKATSVAKLLSQDSPVIAKTSASNDKNALLISVLYESPQNPISLEKLKEYITQIQKNNDFKCIVVFSIQKGTYAKVADFLESEVPND